MIGSNYFEIYVFAFNAIELNNKQKRHLFEFESKVLC